MRSTRQKSAGERACFIGRSFEINYGAAMTVLNVYADDGETMRYEVTAGPYKGASAQVRYEFEEIGPGLYALSWQEADQGTVVHIDDFTAGRSRSFYTTARNGFVRMAGILREISSTAR